ncbi:PREDICTED: uncharacterized protein LOC108609497 [Drosophila arizonae]|uniref:Uncharacterized protein LOC108609497 n=1 Tax=Drosophila arizonae TaxID=7263 RepID=A0ABM1NP21_DROAR|nr:PREDICTED: uncharacterized protein LOC108609497 [Drosophila arizonae]
MGVFRIRVFILFIYFCCSFLYSVPNVSGHGNTCFNCTELENCKASKHYVKYVDSADTDKVVLKTPADKADPILEKCLDDGYRINDTLKGTVCSGSSDGLCHAIGQATGSQSVLFHHCGNCYNECDCFNQNGIARTEGAIILTMCLAAFYTLIQ